MKTKKLIFVLVILCLAMWVKPDSVLSQPLTDSTVNFYTLSAYYDHYYDSLIQVRGNENMKGTGYTDYLRWKWFYIGRHGTNGDLNEIYEAIQDYQENFQEPLDLVDESDWKYAGPFEIPRGHNGAPSRVTGKGMILSLWVSDGYHSLMYAGSHHGGLWKTTDGGLNWHPLNDQDFEIHGVSSIAVDPEDYNTLYITCNSSLGEFSHYSIGLYKSTNGGINWERLSTPFNYPSGSWASKVRKIIITPNDPNTLYFLTYRDVSRSVDRGSNWDIVFSRDYFPWSGHPELLENHDGFFDFKITPWNADLAYLAGSEVFSVNTATWYEPENISDNVFLIGLNPEEMINHPHRCEISMHENYPGIVWFCYACVYDRGDGEKNYLRIVRLDDSGYHLLLDEDISGYANIGVSGDKLEFTVSPSNPNIFYVGGIYLEQVMVIEGSSTTMNPLTFGSYPGDCWVHDDIRDMQIFSNGTHDTLFLANDAGLSWGAIDESNPNGCHDGEWHWHHPFNSTENGLNVTEFYGIGTYNGPSDLVAGGCQDLSDMLLNNGDWINFGQGDGSEVVWDPGNPDIFYYSEWQYGILSRTNDLGLTHDDFDIVGPLNVMIPLEVDRSPGPTNKYTILYTSMKDVENPQYKGALVKYSNVDNFDPQFSVPDPQVLHRFSDSLSDIEVAIPGQSSPKFFVSTFKSYANIDNPPQPEDYTGCIYSSKYIGTTLSFDDISANLAGCGKCFISDIEVNTFENPNSSVWVALANYSTGDQDFKVYKTADNGDTWEPFSQGLPPGMPVFNLKFVPEFQYLLAVTDVGIFKNDLQGGDWYPFKNNLPSKIVTDLEINRDQNTIIAATFGRGLWKTPYRCHYTDIPETIESQTWNLTTHILDHSIIIPDGVTLTINNCSVYLPSEAKIVVQRGGTLVLDNCTLTSACNDLWWGVEVQGDARYSQLEGSQGKIILNNGAVIEKARKAIFCGRNIEYDNPDREYTGGIVDATDAWFLNNRYGVMFWYYPYENISTFSSCKFQTTEPLADGSLPEYFITMVKVHGIDIGGCTFENLLNNRPNMRDQGAGIFSLDAGFEIHALINPLSIQRSQFKNLEYGVFAMKYSEDLDILIHESQFFGNLTGIYGRGLEQLSLVSNDFNIYRLDVIGIYIYGGIYLDHCTGYQIQANTFYGETSTAEQVVGLTINNSGEAFNEINDNIFTNLYIGTLAQNNNYSMYQNSGLKILSNCYFDDEYDIAVTGYEGCKDCGIAYFQGASDAPAGNIFSKHDTPDYSDYYNETLPIQYFSHLYNLLDPEDWYPENVSPVPFIQRVRTDMQYTGDCDSRGGLITDIDSIKTLYLTQTYKVDSLQDLLNELIDGGNTQGLGMDIDLSQEDESLELQQELLNTSPYLSDTILIKSAQKEDVLTPALVKDIMVANPQSAKSGKVLEALENRENPMPEIMMQEILQGRDTIGQKEILEAEISNAGFHKEMFLNRLISLYRADTLNDNTDSIVQLLADYNTLPAKYRLMMVYLEKNDTTYAQNILANIPQQFELSGSQSLVNDHWNDYLEILIEIKKDSLMLPELDSLQIEQLVNLSQFDDQPGCLAGNILHFLGKIEVSPLYILPESQLKSSPNATSNYPATIQEKEPYIKLYPNPAKNYVIVEYDIKEGSSEGSLYLYDSSGKIKFNKILRAQNHSLIINTKDWVEGIYLYNFTSDYHYKQSGKLIITK